MYLYRTLFSAIESGNALREIVQKGGIYKCFVFILYLFILFFGCSLIDKFLTVKILNLTLYFNFSLLFKKKYLYSNQHKRKTRRQ